MYFLKKIWNPELFQGKYKRKRYFEGWYFKMIDRDGRNIFAVIPGIALGEGPEDAHAFVQVSEAIEGRSWYFRFPFSEFRYSGDSFDVGIGNSHFTREGISIDVSNGEAAFRGILSFSNIVPFPGSLLSPGIMGPFTFIPFMECYHGVINLHHEIHGNLSANSTDICFEGGCGYIEKDWGRSFPEAWIWLQSNHFDREDASVMVSVAKIPWFHRHFTGFISFVRLGRRFYRIATYTGARITALKCRGDELEIAAEDGSYKLQVFSRNFGGSRLKAPKKGLMSIDIVESITAEVDVRLTDAKGRTVFEGRGFNTGQEIAGDITVLGPELQYGLNQPE